MMHELRRPSGRRYWPLAQLVLARVREFYREPEALFWVYGFPILMVVALGIAFRNRPIETIHVAVIEGTKADETVRALRDQSPAESHRQFEVGQYGAEEARRSLRTGRVDLVVEPGEPNQPEPNSPAIRYAYDPGRPESVVARAAVDDVLQRHAGRRDPAQTADVEFSEPGGRYIDFLVPGLVGMSLMGGGLWGVGFVTVDMRIRKLLKRFLATPMKK